jgi:hypothetical protein
VEVRVFSTAPNSLSRNREFAFGRAAPRKWRSSAGLLRWLGLVVWQSTQEKPDHPAHFTPYLCPEKLTASAAALHQAANPSIRSCACQQR